MTNKEINRKIADLAGYAKVYNIRSHEYQWENVTIKELVLEDYAGNIDLAINAARHIADKYNYTFVLTYTVDDHWRASFGNYNDCAEYNNIEPAYAICVAVLKFMEQL